MNGSLICFKKEKFKYEKQLELKDNKQVKIKEKTRIFFFLVS